MAVAFVSTPAATIKAAASSGSFASFSPNAGSGYLVVVSAATNQSGVAATTVAWASGGSGTWAKLKSFNFNQFQPTIEVWAVHCTAAPGASVISVTGNAFVTSVHAPIREMTGHDTTLPTTGGTATSTAAAGTISCTPNSTGGRIVVGALDVNEGFTATPNAATTMLDSFNNGGAESYACFGTSNTTASTAQTLGVTNTLTGNIQLALEILPAAATPLPTPQPGRRGLPRWWRPRARARASQPPTGPAFNGSYPIPPQARSTLVPPPFLHARGRSAQPVPPPTAAVTVTWHPDSNSPRPRWSPPRRRATAQPPVAVTATWVPESNSPRQPWRMRARPRQAQLVPAPIVQVSVPLPPQARTALVVPPFLRARGPQAQPVPPQVLVVTAGPSVPQARTTLIVPWFVKGRGRQAQVTPPQQQTVVVTIPVQPPRRRLRTPPAPRGYTATPIQITVTAVPPQPARRVSRPLFRPRPKATQPVPTAPVVTIQALPPQPPARRRPWPWHHFGRGAQYVPPQSLVVVSIPVTVTGTDRPTTTVTGSDRPSASVSGSDQATVTITST